MLPKLIPSALEAIDDKGISWLFMRDSPAAIANACRLSVQRWRLAKIGLALPGLIPKTCDVGAPDCPNSVLVDFSSAIAPFLSGRGPRGKDAIGWDPAFRGMLASAVSGGQWCQARKWSVKKWNITDSNCQLCHNVTGTLSHRSNCTKTTPAEGWPEPPPEANLLIRRLSPERLTLLKERGLLVLRLPAPPEQFDGSFVWRICPLNSPDLQDATWYFDGSLLHGKWKEYRSTGFSICVVAKNGSLLGFGHGTPPHWCLTAAAAEAWALFVVVSECPFPPDMRTDCLSLLRTAEQGTRKATHRSRMLARVWVLIAGNLDAYISALTDTQKLVWMPAHQSRGMVGEITLSNGVRLTSIDRRANRLVDAGAKLEAALRQMPPAVAKLLGSASHAVKFYVKLLGMITYAANHCPEVVYDELGNASTKMVRDAVPKPKGPNIQKPKTVSEQPPAKKPARVLTTLPWTEPAKVKKNVAGLHAKRMREYQHACTARRVEEIGSGLSRSSLAGSASSKMTDLVQRVRERSDHVVREP